MKSFTLLGDVSGGEKSITVLKGVSFEVEQGHWVSLMGPSGSGKSTLLSLLAGLEAPSSGRVFLAGTNLFSLGEEARARFRAHHVGFVFQSFRLIPHLTALENVMVPLEILGTSSRKAQVHASELLDRVGLSDRSGHRPGQLSGGEQQRVALARAFVAKPKILFADEPTGNLDEESGEIVLSLMKQLQEQERSSLFVVTHNPEVAARGQKTLRLTSGKLSES